MWKSSCFSETPDTGSHTYGFFLGTLFIKRRLEPVDKTFGSVCSAFDGFTDETALECEHFTVAIIAAILPYFGFRFLNSIFESSVIHSLFHQKAKVVREAFKYGLRTLGGWRA